MSALYNFIQEHRSYGLSVLADFLREPTHVDARNELRRLCAGDPRKMRELVNSFYDQVETAQHVINEALLIETRDRKQDQLAGLHSRTEYPRRSQGLRR